MELLPILSAAYGSQNLGNTAQTFATQQFGDGKTIGVGVHSSLAQATYSNAGAFGSQVSNYINSFGSSPEQRQAGIASVNQLMAAAGNSDIVSSSGYSSCLDYFNAQVGTTIAANQAQGITPADVNAGFPNRSSHVESKVDGNKKGEIDNNELDRN